MSDRLLRAAFVVVVFLFVSCSYSGQTSLIKGKWVLASPVTGGSPTSYWFKSAHRVVASWEEQNIGKRSSGRYEFIDKSHIKIHMNDGFYKGITFFFEIVKLDTKELVLRGSIREIKMKRVT